MTTNAIPAFTESLPVCPKCNGAGYYVHDVPVQDPNFGVLFLCDCKKADKERRAAEDLHRLSNLGELKSKTFENFDPGVAGVTYAYERARAYAQNLAGSRPWLVLFGNYGCGKTHLAAAIANYRLQRDAQVLFSSVPDLLDHLRSTFGPNSEIGYDRRFDMVREVPLLILDDLGTENTTPWAREKLYQIINHRYNYRLPTVITSNREPEDIEARIFSRMFDQTLSDGIMIEAEDYRLPKDFLLKRSEKQRITRRKRP